MATAFKNASKGYQKVHRERSQLQSRRDLGLLEKRKDFKLRAQEHHKKERTLKFMSKQALDRNPDEFYYNMVNSKMDDGIHKADDKVITYTDAQLKLFESQDIRYIRFKKGLEKKKIEELKASLQFVGFADCQKNQHIIFCDTKKGAEEFEPAKYFDTLPELVNRRYNRPRISDLKNNLLQQLDDNTLAEASMEKDRLYSMLVKRIDREKQLGIIEAKLAVRIQLLDKSTPRKKVSDETKESAAIYRYAYRRKR